MKGRLGDKVRLQHIQNAISEIEKYILDKNKNDFEQSSLIFFASLMQIEIIGEAASRLSNSIIENNSEIPWKSIIGLRNIIAHEYFGVDKNTIWDVIINELPELKININNLLQNT